MQARRPSILPQLILPALFLCTGGCTTMLGAAAAALDPNGSLCPGQPYTLGTSVQGAFSVQSCREPDVNTTTAAESYRFDVAQQRDVVVGLDAPGLPVKLDLTRADGVVLATGSGLDGYYKLRTQLAPGAYRIRVRLTNSWERQTGPFQLTTSTDQVGFEGCLTMAALQPGTIQGDWSVADCQAQQVNGTHTRVDYYLLQLPAQRMVDLTLTSEIGSDVSVHRRDGVVVQQAVGGAGAPAHLRVQLAPGMYVVAAEVSFPDGRQTGPYTLQVR